MEISTIEIPIKRCKNNAGLPVCYSTENGEFLCIFYDAEFNWCFAHGEELSGYNESSDVKPCPGCPLWSNE